MAALAALLSGGCSQQEGAKPTSSQAPTPLASNTVLRVHWAGKQKVGVAASAYSLMRLWNLPESRTLEAQMIERLAMAPWQHRTKQSETFTAPIPALQQVFNYMLNDECWLEVRNTDSGDQLVAGIRLDDARAAVCDRSLADVISSLEGTYPSRRSGGWTLRNPNSGKVYELVRAGTWVMFGAAANTNELLREMTARIRAEGDPLAATTNRHWLELHADSYWLANQLGVGQRTGPDLPRITFRVFGDGAYVISTGELRFLKPLNMRLDAWKLPKELVQGDLVGFGAVRGFSSWLEATKLWQQWNLGKAPNQSFVWADTRAPLLRMRFAIPADDAPQLAKRLGESFAPSANEWLAKNATGSIIPWQGGGVAWNNLPLIAPFLIATNDSLLVGGMLPNPPPNTNALPNIYPRRSVDELLATLESRTNLVAFEWETTGARAESTHVLGQILRVIFRHQQLPADTMSSQWLQNMRPRLGNTTTFITLTDPNRLTFERRSTMGFNTFELHAIADWLESPEFPRGLYSTLPPANPPAQLK